MIYQEKNEKKEKKNERKMKTRKKCGNVRHRYSLNAPEHAIIEQTYVEKMLLN